MIEICVEKHEANPWANDTFQLREVLRRISPFLEKDLATMRRVSKTWNKYVLELLNKQGFDEKKIAKKKWLLLARTESYLNKARDFEEGCAEEFSNGFWYTMKGLCLTAAAGISGMMPMLWDSNRNDLKEILAKAAHQILENNSLHFSFEQVNRSMRRFIALGLEEGCLADNCTGTIYHCWNDLLNQSRPAGFDHYIIQDFSITWGSDNQWNSASSYKLMTPLIILASVVCLNMIRSPLNRKLLKSSRENFAIAEEIDQMQRVWKEMQKEPDFSDPALARYRNLMDKKVKAYEKDKIDKIAPWRHFLFRAILSGGYLVSGGVIIYGLIQSLAKASEGDYESYRNFFNHDGIVDPTICSDAYDHAIGLAMKNCTQYIFDQEQLWTLFAAKAPLDQEAYVEQMTLLAKISGGIIGGLFGVKEVMDFLYHAEHMHIAHKTGQAVKRVFQSVTGCVSSAVGWWCRPRQIEYVEIP